MLLFDHLFECCVLLVGLRLSGDVAWDHSLQTLPWLRTITPWICMSLEELHEYALMMCSRFSDDVEREITISMEFCNITKDRLGLPSRLMFWHGYEKFGMVSG